MWTFTFILAFLFCSIHFDCISCTNSKTESLRQTKFPPCKSCRIFIQSFQKSMDKTAKGKFEGGDTAWEEEKLGSYARSEIRLVETQEQVCSDVEEGRDQCYSLNEQYDSIIEDWWFKHQSDEADLFKYFCIDSTKLCCPDFHYGPNCTPCEGYPDNICSNNGKCKGAGTRKGNGKCNCDAGYMGEACNKCDKGFYESYKDDSKLMCSKCHVSCDGSCNKAGPTGCEKCTNGWIMNEEKGCMDINECASGQPVCKSNQFCINSDGSYHCLGCDRSCATCSGDGPDMCIKCADSFTLKDGMCVDAEQENQRQHVFLMRYATYLGLCVATYIILQRNVMVAAVIGIAVAIYISVSEYILNTISTSNATYEAPLLGL